MNVSFRWELTASLISLFIICWYSLLFVSLHSVPQLGNHIMVDDSSCHHIQQEVLRIVPVSSPYSLSLPGWTYWASHLRAKKLQCSLASTYHRSSEAVLIHGDPSIGVMNCWRNTNWGQGSAPSLTQPQWVFLVFWVNIYGWISIKNSYRSPNLNAARHAAL